MNKQPERIRKSMCESTTLLDKLSNRAEVSPSKICYTFLKSGEEESVSLTYHQLDQEARKIASNLQTYINPGDRVLMSYPPGMEFITAFFGCLYAGALAVPAYPPRLKRDHSRLLAMAIDSGSKVVCGVSASIQRTHELCRSEGIEHVQTWMATDEIDIPDSEFSYKRVETNGDSIAYLQYTSGSTASPRGVMVTHANVMHNLSALKKDFVVDENSVFVSWLPHFHDMGLVYGLLLPFYAGVPCYFMSPMAFVQRPCRWLNAMTTYQATHSAGPNFSYDLCVDRVSDQQKCGLDLSHWKVALNGAEPVRKDTLARFEQCFSAYGFNHCAFYPGYGLAEATLEVSGGREAHAHSCVSLTLDSLQRDRDMSINKERNKEFVGCGRVAPDTRVAIVDPSTFTECETGDIGEVWVSGPSVTLGYWNRKNESADTFNCFMNPGGEGPFLRTGDLGFIKDGELYIAGRLKDLIIIGGRNIYPQDIEWSVERCHPLVRPGSVAAFAIEDNDKEYFVVVAEIEHNIRSARKSKVADKDISLKTINDAIVSVISRDHDLSVYDVVLLPPGGINKTSSGKIQRQACRNAYIGGSLNALALVA